MGKVDNSKEICAIIPARGGSRGIPKKNLQPVGGVPLIARTVQAANKSSLINRIIVSTDDSDITEISKEYGAEVLARNEELSNDEASSESALLDVLEQLKIDENYAPDILVFLQCTSPFTTSDDIDGTINTLLNKGADSAFTATSFKHFLWKNNSSGLAVGVNHNEKVIRKRRQDIYSQLLETGSVYVFLTKGFINHKNRFFGNIVAHEIPADRVLEIDTHDELIKANLFINVI